MKKFITLIHYCNKFKNR